MNNELPYRYLDLPIEPLIAGWENFVEDLNSFFVYFDHFGNSLLKPELKELFLECGLSPKRGNLWSKKPVDLPWYYHTDQKTDCELFAINWLLKGQPGLTEWCSNALNYKVEMNGTPGAYGTDTQWWGNRYMIPDVSVKLNRPMMIVTDIPHRVNTLDADTWRISYSLRFEGNPSWETGLKKLSKFIIDQ